MNEYLNFEFRAFEVIPTSCIHMFTICISSTCFIYFIFVCLWHCECVWKCSYLAWMHFLYFKNYLQQFWKAFQNAKICQKALAKAKHQFFAMQYFNFLASVFYSSEDYQELNMAKSKVLIFKIAGNWGTFANKIFG